MSTPHTDPTSAPERNPGAAAPRSSGVFPRARTLGSLGGVAVRVDPSLLLVALLVVATFTTRFTDDRALWLALVMSVVAAVLFFASVLGHELAHAWEGIHRGVRVRAITLFALGGVTEMELDTQRARDEFAISAVGPWSSLVIAAVAGLVAEGSGRLGLDSVADVAGALGWINLALALFNLVPGAPLDGGRVLRSAAWAVTGDRHRATAIASRAGQLVGIGLAVWGVTLVDGPGGILNAVWLVLLGGYIVRGATSELTAGRTERRLSEHVAGDLAPPVLTVPPGTSVELAVARAAGLRADDLVVVVEDGEPVASATVATLRALDPNDAALRRVEDVGQPVTDLAEVDADAGARALATAADEAGLLAVRHADGSRVLTSRRGVDGALRRVLGDEDRS